MAKNQNIPGNYRVWIEAHKRYHLSDAQVQMARKLGLNPCNFGKLANEKQELWKKPLPEFIEEIYFKRLCIDCSIHNVEINCVKTAAFPLETLHNKICSEFDVPPFAALFLWTFVL